MSENEKNIFALHILKHICDRINKWLIIRCLASPDNDKIDIGTKEHNKFVIFLKSNTDKS